MLVYNCLLFNDPNFPEEVVSKDLVGYVETAIKKSDAFTVQVILDGTDPRRAGWAIGFYPHYGMAFISDPNSLSGLSAIDVDNRRLVFNKNESAFRYQRDAFVYIRPGNTYVRKPYKAVLEEFLAKGYTIVEFAQQQPGENIMWYSTVLHRNPSQLPFGARLSIDALLLPNNQV
ncbi:hypothetical protein HYV85_01790 [Candidatus Woesearchaeota archaeon]|nr:hypothetical protein [Candidatus Woesearchaeota archaeon]